MELVSQTHLLNFSSAKGNDCLNSSFSNAGVNNPARDLLGLQSQKTKVSCTDNKMNRYGCPDSSPAGCS